MSRPRRVRQRAKPLTELEWGYLNDMISYDDDVDPAERSHLWELELNCALGTCEPITEMLWGAYRDTILAQWVIDRPGPGRPFGGGSMRRAVP